MADYIKREDLLERIDGIWDCADMVFEPNDHCCNMDYCASCKWRETKDAIRRIIEHTPAADVRPVVHARWIVTVRFDDCYYANCPVCNTTQVFFWNKELTKFCPNCGAVMDKEVDDG